ncbi:MAG: DUF6065 family protein [Pseudomonadota bacterium]
MSIVFNVQAQILIDDDRLRPKPAHEVLPDWKKTGPAKIEDNLVQGRTVRTCPALHDYLHLGYVIPLWTDVRLERVSVDPQGRGVRDPNGAYVHWQTAHAAFPIEFHGGEQVEGAEPLKPPFNLKQVVKPICPWLVETPPGWSVLVLPLALHETQHKLPLEPLPGVINTDHWHQMHTPCRWMNVEPTMTMRAGAPFMHVIPFRRDESLAAEFKLITEQARLANLAGVLNDFSGGYRRQQKVADDKRRDET